MVKFLSVLFLCGILAVVYCDYLNEIEKRYWEQDLQLIEQVLKKALEKVPNKNEAIDAGIAYLKGTGGKPKELSQIGDEVFKKLTPEQKLEVIKLLEGMKKA